MLSKLHAMLRRRSPRTRWCGLACQSWEAWYLGDLQAVAAAFANPKADSPAPQKSFVTLMHGESRRWELERLVPRFQGVGARAMAQHLREPEHNQSHSYGKFVGGAPELRGDGAVMETRIEPSEAGFRLRLTSRT